MFVTPSYVNLPAQVPQSIHPAAVSAAKEAASAHAIADWSTSYSLPFGPNRFLPSQAEADFPGFLTPSAFPTAEYCGHCHEAVHRQWRESVHANSFRAPFYRKDVDLLIREKGIEFSRHCEGCHNPIALFSGALTPASAVLRSFDQDGVTCSVCHSIVRLKSATGLASYVMGQPAVMMDEKGNPVTGLPTYSEILARPDLHKRAVMRDFYRTSDFCGACHKANLPPELNGYKWLRAFSTFDEWQQSSWSRETPLPFYKKGSISTCQTCHMMRVAGQDHSTHDGTIASHRWLGANTAIPAYYGYTDQMREIQAFLKKDTLKIDIFAVSQSEDLPAGQTDSSVVAPIDQSDFTLDRRKPITISVVITNTGIGHSLVPEQRDFYESWVQFTVTDPAGAIVFRSGYIQPDGKLEPGAHSYTNRIISRDGSTLDHHQVWSVLTRAYDNTIQSGRSDLVRYRFHIPANLSRVTITAQVNYRRFRRGYTDFVFDDPASAPDRMPTVVMASASAILQTGANYGAHDLTPEQRKLTARRWNNYGIGLLDQQQFAAAAGAFVKVAELDPSSADGWLNQGVAEYMNGSYDAALRSLRHAQQIEPSMRARYYEGLCYRWQYRYDQAIERLAPVAAAFPRFRQVRQDLGYVYFLHHDYERARQQYLAVQAIDPDDLLSHRWLAATYRHLGKPEEASREEAFTSLYKDDPVAGWAAQRYWQQHPEIARELVPFHLHSDDPADIGRQAARMNDLQNAPSLLWFLH